MPVPPVAAETGGRMRSEHIFREKEEYMKDSIFVEMSCMPQ